LGIPTGPGARVSAVPGGNGDPDEWEDEWNRDDWETLSVVDRGERNEDSWLSWVLRLLGIALVLPLVLGVLFLLLILIF